MHNYKTSVKITGSIIVIFLLVSLTFAGIRDRADGTHNVGKIGYFVTNVGQFYPWGGSFEQTLEYPLNSGHIAMYRQCIMIGATMPNGKYNVVSAASGAYEEWEPVHGYHAGLFKLAMSDKPETWPKGGWPVVDGDGNPVVLSQQDSYCVFTDSASWRYAQNGEEDMLIDLWVYQTVYSWGVPDADKFVIIKMEVENKGDKYLSDVYLNFYSDLDVGGMNNAAEEWADDCIGFDKDRELIYFYDSDNYSNEWQQPDPFMPGVTFLKTPNGLGITDWHWIDVYKDEVAVNSTYWDSLHYSLMRSDTGFVKQNDTLSHYFHPGDNPLNGYHYDDPNTTRITDSEGNLVGGAMVAYICNGPIDMASGDKVEYWVGVAVGDDQDDLLKVIDGLRGYYKNYEETGDFGIPVLPKPKLRAQAKDRKITLTWDDSLDIFYENKYLSEPYNDLQGYIIYRTTDPFLRDWAALDTIPMQFKDKEEQTVNPNAYVYIDSLNVYNGFTHYYSLSAYRFNQFGLFEETVRLTDISNVKTQENAVQLNPASSPAVEKADMDKIRVVPNPYVVSAQWDRSRIGNSVYGEPVRNIAFTNLPSPCTVQIFTVDGDLVQTIEHSGQSGRLEWNLLTRERRPVVSGVYFYHIKSEIGEKVGRFAVIR